MIVIPARLKSSRFENKILAEIDGLPMVIRTAKRVEGLDNICIATDSKEVMELAKTHNIKAVMTSLSHQSGTDRINEASNILGLGDDEIVINVQADEPYIEREIVEKIIETTRNSNALMVSCYKEIHSEDADNPNHVKVVLDEQERAIYFSRAKVPHHRDHHDHTSYNGHLGIYGFKKKNLNKFCSFGETALEQIEKLEQLRALGYNEDIQMIKVSSKSFGIDTQEDLNHLFKLLADGSIV